MPLATRWDQDGTDPPPCQMKSGLHPGVTTLVQH